MKAKILTALTALSVFVMALSPIALAQNYNMNGSQYQITISNGFSPQSMTIPLGGTIMWINQDAMNHTVTADNGSFDSSNLAPGATFSYTFNTPGTFAYYCRYHGAPGGQGMSGTVTVVPFTNYGYNNYNTQNPTPTPFLSPNYNYGGNDSSYNGAYNGYMPNTVNSNTISGNVISGHGPSSGGVLVINQITPVQTTGIAGGTFANGWKWIFDVTTPPAETNLSMQFSDWFRTNYGGTIPFPAANNIRFFSAQSSNANSQSTAIGVTAPNSYSTPPMVLNGNLNPDFAQGRHIQITVEVRIPAGVPTGTYSTNFAIQTL